MIVAEYLVWVGLALLFVAAIAGVEEAIEMWAQRRKAQLRRERQRAAVRRRAHREAWALDYDWQTWAGEEGNQRTTDRPAIVI